MQIATDMPQLSNRSKQRITAYKAKAEKLKTKARQWRNAMNTVEYAQAMERLEQERGGLKLKNLTQ